MQYTGKYEAVLKGGTAALNWYTPSDKPLHEVITDMPFGAGVGVGAGAAAGHELSPWSRQAHPFQLLPPATLAQLTGAYPGPLWS
jgi:hypothetical protein